MIERLDNDPTSWGKRMTAAKDWSRCERVVHSAFALLQQYLLSPTDMPSPKPKLLAQVKGARVKDT